MSRKRNKSTSKIDIALLSCGLVELPVFKDCVEAIKREAEDVGAKVYVYLNGAPKETKPDFIQSIPDGFEIKQSSERVGFPAGANRAIKAGSAPLVLFITDDIILHPGSLKILIDRMKSDNEIGVCGMKLIFPEDSADPTRPAGRVQHIGHGVDIRGEVTHPLMGWKPDNPKCNVSREVISVTGGVFLVQRTAFQKVGGFFEGYGLGYFEDVDLNLSIRDRGWKIWVETGAVGTHYTNMSMNKSETPPNMAGNKMMFRMRNQSRLVNDSWTFWALIGIVLTGLRNFL